MTEMEERVARAIYEAHCAGHVPPIHPHWDSDPDGRLLALSDARAAIAAMREPTEDMIDDMQASLDCVSINRCVEQALQVWRGGIDAALSEPRP